MPPSRRVYCTHCTQTFFCTDADTCSLCGKSGGLVDPNGPEAIAQVVAKKPERMASGQPAGNGFDNALDVVDSALNTWRLLKLGAAGVAGIVIGCVLLFSPGLRDDPSTLSMRDLLIGIGPLIAGVVILGFLGWLWWRTETRR